MRFLTICVLCASALCGVLVSGVIAAQVVLTFAPPKKLVTNEDVVQMVKSKFSDSTIINAIRSNDTFFDLSSTKITALKNAGVSQVVIAEMLSASTSNKESNAAAVATSRSQLQPSPPPFSSSAPNTESAERQSPSANNCPANLQSGAYYWSGNSWLPLRQINMADRGVPGLTSQILSTFRDARALAQIQDGAPRFCLRFLAVQPGDSLSPSERDIVIARFDEKADQRVLEAISGDNMLTFHSELGEAPTPDVEVTSVDANTYLVSPKSPLRAGEYLLIESLSGFHGYDFGFHPQK